MTMALIRRMLMEITCIPNVPQDSKENSQISVVEWLEYWTKTEKTQVQVMPFLEILE